MKSMLGYCPTIFQYRGCWLQQVWGGFVLLFLVGLGFNFINQMDLKFSGSHDLPTSATQILRTIGICHHAWLYVSFYCCQVISKPIGLQHMLSYSSFISPESDHGPQNWAKSEISAKSLPGGLERACPYWFQCWQNEAFVRGDPISDLLEKRLSLSTPRGYEWPIELFLLSKLAILFLSPISASVSWCLTTQHRTVLLPSSPFWALCDHTGTVESSTIMYITLASFQATTRAGLWSQVLDLGSGFVEKRCYFACLQRLPWN